MRLLILLIALACAAPAAAQQASVAQARAAFEQADYADAVQIATRVLRQDSDNVDALLVRARAYEASARFPAAASDYRRVLDLDVGNAEAAAGLRRSQARLRGASPSNTPADPASAIEAQVRASPDDLPLRLRYAESLFRSREFRAAADQYEAYLNRTQGSPRIAQRYLVAIASYSGGSARGEAEALRFLQLYPTSDDLYMRLGYFRLWQGETEGARQAFEQALRLNPGNAEARRGLAAVDDPSLLDDQRRESDYPIDVLTRELREQPGDDAKRLRLAALLVASGRYFEARQNLDALPERFGDDAEATRLRAVVARNLPAGGGRAGAQGGTGGGQPAEFIVDRLYREVRANPRDDARRFRLVEALIDYDRFGEAFDQLMELREGHDQTRRWLELFAQIDAGYIATLGSSPIYEIDRLTYRLRYAPGDDATRIALAQALLDEGRAEEAYQTLTQGRLTVAGDARTRALFERIEAVRERVRAERIAQLEAALTRHPDSREALAELATLYLADERTDASIALYERLIALSPYDFEARFAFAQTLNAAGFYDDALDEAIALLDQEPDSFRYKQLFVQTAIAAGRVDETVETFLLDLLERDPDNAELILELAAIRLRQERLDEADGLVRRALAIGLSGGERGVDESTLGLGQRADMLAALIERERVRLEDAAEIALLNEARILARNGFYGDAVTAYEDYFAVTGRRTRDELKEYAGVYSAAGDFVTAVSIYRDLLLERYAYDVAKEIAKNLYYLGDYAGTIASAGRVLEENPRDFEVRILLADAYREAERFELAAQQYELARQYGGNSELLERRESLLRARAAFSIVQLGDPGRTNFATVFSPHASAVVAQGGGADYQRYGGGMLAQITVPGGLIWTLGLTSHWLYGTELLTLDSPRLPRQEANQVYTGLVYDLTRRETRPGVFAFTNRLEARVGLFDYDGGRRAPFVEARYWRQSPERYRASLGIQSTDGAIALWSAGGPLYDLRLTQLDARYESRTLLPDSLVRVRGVAALNLVTDSQPALDETNQGVNVIAEGSVRVLPRFYLGAAYYYLGYETTNNLYFSPDRFQTYDAFMEFERGSEMGNSYTRVRGSLGVVGNSGGTVAYRLDGDVIRRLTPKLSFVFNWGLGQSSRPFGEIDDNRYTIATASLGVYWTL
jgi:thioredoxin-like negative regulator of GroEL